MSATNDSVNISRWVIEHGVEQGIERGNLEFRPLEIARAAKAPLPLVFDHMARLSRQKKLVLIWQVRCVSCGRALPASSAETPEACPHCGGTFSDAFPVFVASPDFVAYVLAGRKTS